MGNIHVLLRMSVKDWLPFIQRKSERLLSFLRSRAGEDNLFVEFQVERVTQSTRQAVARYVMRKYPGRILNIVASKRHVAETVTDTRHVWEELGGREVRPFRWRPEIQASFLLHPMPEKCPGIFRPSLLVKVMTSAPVTVSPSWYECLIPISTLRECEADRRCHLDDFFTLLCNVPGLWRGSWSVSVSHLVF